jgi:hypothetical protein
LTQALSIRLSGQEHSHKQFENPGACWSLAIDPERNWRRGGRFSENEELLHTNTGLLSISGRFGLIPATAIELLSPGTLNAHTSLGFERLYASVFRASERSRVPNMHRSILAPCG